MKCRQCDQEIESSSNNVKVYCSEACRKKYKRLNPDISTRTQSNPDTDKVQPGQTYEVVEDTKCYGRQAVKYPGISKWPHRPEPYNPTDIPCPNNRCIYNTIDGDRYIIDACGGKIDKVNGSWGV